MKRDDCRGCHDDFYNAGGGGGCAGCWSFDPKKKLVLKKKVSIDQVPPWKQKPIKVPPCYHVPRFVFVGPEQER